MRRAALLLAVALSACGKSPETPTAAAPAGAPAAKAGRNVVLFLGDSLSAGFGVAPEAAFPALLGARWGTDGAAYRARNAGVSGSTTAGLLETLDWTLAPDVHTVFLCIGANDGLRGLDLTATRANLAAIIEKIQGGGIRVVLAGIKVPPNYGEDYSRRFEAMYPDLARKYGLKLMPFLLEDVAGRRGSNLADGIHPNEAGHRRIAANVQAFLSREGLLK